MEVEKELLESAKLIALREKNNAEPFKSQFAEIHQGIRNFHSFLMSGNFHLDQAITASAKATSLAARILTENSAPLEKYQGENLADFRIENREGNFLNKLKRLPDQAAFFIGGKQLIVWKRPSNSVS